MKTRVFDGNALAAEKEIELKARVAELGKPLKLVSIVVGDDPASHLYVRLKGEAAERVGIDFVKYELSVVAPLTSILGSIEVAGANPGVTGVMVQLPLPEEVREGTVEVLDAIDPRKDVDCLTTTNLQLVLDGRPKVLPATVKAVVDVLKNAASSVWHVARSGENFLMNKKVVVVGRSRVLGRPLAAELRRLGAEVTVAHSQTGDLGAVTREAEILVSATGKAGLITGEMVKEGTIVVDVGEPKGDVDFESVRSRASFITPVPGGVGPVTVVSLLENVVEAAASTNHI